MERNWGGRRRRQLVEVKAKMVEVEAKMALEIEVMEEATKYRT